MAGTFDFLDNLGATIGQLGGQAVQAAGQVASERIRLEQIRALTPDQSPVPASSAIQTAQPGLTINPMWIIAGAVALVALIVLVKD